MAKTFEALEKSGSSRYLKKKGKIITLLETSPEVRHQFEILKSQIILKEKKERIQTILFTSYNHGEGTTTIASNFAESLTQDPKYKVLLVDGNTRSPDLHQLQAFVENYNNLVFQNLFRDDNKNLYLPKPNAKTNLAVLTCNQVDTHPSQIFNHHKFNEFLQEAKKFFDFIVFDSSPIGKYYDSIVLATHVQGVILVIQAEKTTQFEISRAKDILEERHIPIIGIILNRRKFRIPGFVFSKLLK
jgi:capsular exopolysaccharide synthesis family protein